MRALTFALPSIIATLTAFSAASAFAADELRPMNEGLAATSMASANKKWSFGVFIQGSGKQSGVALDFQTPLAWNWLGARIAYASNEVSIPVSDHISLGEVIAGVKIQLNRDSSANIYEYIIENFNFYTPIIGETAGSRNGFETAFGAEWRHHYIAGENNEVDGAAYLEFGQSTSYLRTAAAVGGESIGDGFMARLGFRRFF
jgi:hypothetical protein